MPCLDEAILRSVLVDYKLRDWLVSPLRATWKGNPGSHFWPLQLTETGLFVGLAALLIGFAAWWTRERLA